MLAFALGSVDTRDHPANEERQKRDALKALNVIVAFNSDIIDELQRSDPHIVGLSI